MPTRRPDRVSTDIALIELWQPIRNTSVTPFDTGAQPKRGEEVGVVSYAADRAEAPSLQEVCSVMNRQAGILVMSCDVDFGASGAPVFSFSGPEPRIVSVVAAKASMDGQSVAIGTAVEHALELLQAELAAGRGFTSSASGTRWGQKRRGEVHQAMIRVILSVLLGLSVIATTAQAQTNKRKLTDREDLYGWEAIGRLDVGTRSFCTGTLIAQDLVLTAAHCALDKRTGKPYAPGEVTFRAGPQQRHRIGRTQGGADRRPSRLCRKFARSVGSKHVRTMSP